MAPKSIGAASTQRSATPRVSSKQRSATAATPPKQRSTTPRVARTPSGGRTVNEISASPTDTPVRALTPGRTKIETNLVTKSEDSERTPFELTPAKDWQSQAASTVAQPSTKNGNTLVVARFRPPTTFIDENSKQHIDFGEDGCSCGLVAEAGKEMQFRFNRVFQPVSTQEDVYEVVGRPIVQGVLNGYNGAILAYGQTGSGKTHTMLGPQGAKELSEGIANAADMGIVPRALLELQAFAESTKEEIELRVSYVEIYNERVLDLLGKDMKEVADTIRQDTTIGGLNLPDVADLPIRTAVEAMEILRIGSERRTVASTQMNRDSSRSHAIFIVTVTNSIQMDKRTEAQLYLVDLAGSERIGKTGVIGQQLTEANHINLSLHSLGQVIWSLSQKSPHIPYRNSKLTRLLQNCLGGNGRTAMVVNASSDASNIKESISTMRFGDRAATIRSVPRMNIVLSASELKAELQKTRKDLADLRAYCRRLERENDALQYGLPSRPGGRADASTPSTSASSPSFAEPPTEASDGQSSGHELPVSAQHELDMPSVDIQTALMELATRRLFVRDLLPSLLCPLTQEVMYDPVVAADGFTYSRLAIEQHIARSKGLPAISPMTGRWLANKQLVPNMVLQQQVRRNKADLPPPKKAVPLFARVGMNQLGIIFRSLDGNSLARCLAVSSDFFAVGGRSELWSPLLLGEFGNVSGNAAQVREPRALYGELQERRRQTAAAKAAENGKPATVGLHLFAPARRSKARSVPRK